MPVKCSLQQFEKEEKYQWSTLTGTTQQWMQFVGSDACHDCH